MDCPTSYGASDGAVSEMFLEMYRWGGVQRIRKELGMPHAASCLIRMMQVVLWVTVTLGIVIHHVPEALRTWPVSVSPGCSVDLSHATGSGAKCNSLWPVQFDHAVPA